jgi:hypothetical protein
VKQRWMFAALSVLAFSAPAAAADPLRLAQAVEAGVLPPHEIITIVRSTRLDPIGRPVLRGPNYVVLALDEGDREMRVIVNARRGEIIRIVPVQTASRMPPPGGGYATGPYERMERYERGPAPRYVTPEGYRYGARPPVIDDEDDDLPYEQQAPRPPGSVPSNIPGAAPRPGTAPPRTGYADPPPVIRSTPPASGPGVVRGTELPPPPSGSRVVTTNPPRGAAPSASRDGYTPEPDREGGMLPPPPERFPQRVAPAPEKPKPVKRDASAAAPKAAPLPKPKPATPASATAPKPAAPAVAPAAPAASPPAVETKAEAPKPQPLPEQQPAAEQKPADGGVPH